MKPANFTFNETCFSTGDALSGNCGSRNQNVHTPFSGVSHSIAMLLQSAVTIGVSSRLGFLLIFLLTVFMTSAQPVIKEGDVFTEGGIHYKVTKYQLAAGNTVAVCNNGIIYNPYSGTVIIPEKVNYANKEFDVTKLDEEAFRNCSNLDSVYIPVSVIAIGKRSFKNCTKLRNVTVPNSVGNIGNAAFLNCSNLRAIVLPRSLTAINDSVFYSCSMLRDFQLPEKLISIGKSAFNAAFRHMTALDNLIIPDMVTEIGDDAFSGTYLHSVTLGSSVLSIGNRAFFNCTNINSISIPNSVTTIGSFAFSGCTSYAFTSVTIPNAVTSIGDGTFYGCTYLSGVALPGNLISIGSSAFNGCTNLTTLNFPASVMQIKEYAFADCAKLSTTLNAGQYLTEIGKNAFRLTDVQFNVSAENKNYSSQDGVLFNKMKTVAIQCPTSKTTFTFPNTLKKIEEYAFSKSRLTNVVLPGALDTISKYAFQYCTALSQLTLPASLKGVDGYAFGNCTGLQKIKAYMVDPPVIVTTALGSVPASCQLQVPLTSFDLYKAANGWKSLTVISFGGALGTVFNANGIYYKIESESEVKVVAHPSGNQNYTGSKTIPSTVSYLDVSYNVSSIDKSAFAYSGISSVSIPNSVEFIGEWAFTNCNNLTEITIPNSVTYIGESAFATCPILTKAVLSEAITSINNGMFQSCPALTNFVIPPSVISIGEYAFDQCNGLITMNIPSSVTQIGRWAFQQCRQLESITISDAVEVLPDYVFWGCESLSQVKLPASLKEIGVETFYNCGEITEIELPRSLTKIGASAFYRTGLIEISIPAAVSHIGQHAFYGCDNLKDVYMFNRTPIGITRDVFGDIYYSQNNLYVRSRSIPLYKKTAVWKDFQIKSIESIHTNTIRELTGRDIVVQVKTDLVENEDQFTAFQFEMKYDTQTMDYKDFSTANLMTNVGSVLVNSSTPGILKVGYMSDKNLSGEGALINLRFTLRNSGVVRPEFSRFLYNAFDLMNFNTGNIEVIAYGDVDYNQEVQSYDASLVLINSVGLNPIPDSDTYPWSALRNDVSDVDASTTLSALDAGLILQKSVDLLDKFPVEETAPSPVKRQKAPETKDEANVTVLLENNQLIFKSGGDLIGLNVDISGENHLLEMPKIHTSFIQAKNINERTYKVALATAAAMPAGTTIMTIPLKEELTGDLILTLKANNHEKVITINKASTGVEKTEDFQSVVFLNAASGELIIQNPENIRSIDVYSLNGCRIYAQNGGIESIVNPGKLISGVYLVVLTDFSGQKYTSKIVMK